MSIETKIITPPHSKESEMMVLGCMLTNEHAFKLASESMEESDFYFIEHKILFQVIQEAYRKNHQADVHLMAEELKRTGKLQTAGGINYLLALAQYVGTSAYVEEYIRLVRNKTLSRELTHLHRDFGEELAKGKDPYEILESIGKEVKSMKTDNPKDDSAFKHLLNLALEGDLVKEIRYTSPGVRVGFEVGKIDLKIPGGAVTIVAGPTGHGKTMVLVNLILNYLELHPDKQACFFSYEESRAAIQCLFLNTYINCKLSNNNRESIKSYFRDGHAQFITQESQVEFFKGKEEFFNKLIDTGRLRIFYSDCCADELVQNIKFLRKNADIGLVAIDYMQLLSLKNKKTLPRQEELKQICLMLKDCAIDTGLPMLVAAQFNRTVIAEADLSPTAIGEAGDIERAANMVIGIWNRNYQGLSREGNKGKNGQPVPQAPQMYMEVLKGRETGIGHASVFDLDGNTGKLSTSQKMGIGTSDETCDDQPYKRNRLFSKKGTK